MNSSMSGAVSVCALIAFAHGSHRPGQWIPPAPPRHAPSLHMLVPSLSSPLILPPNVDEHVLPGEQPDAYVTRLSRAKAQAVLPRAPGEGILAAGTTVVLDGRIFEKPT